MLIRAWKPKRMLPRKRQEWQGYMLGHILMLDALWLTGIRSQRLECGFNSCVNSTDVFSLGGESVIIESDSDQIMDEQDTRNNPVPRCFQWMD